MNKNRIEAFSSEVIEQLKYYVYRLLDPRNGETFYIGKGKGNRVFDHVHGAIEEDESNEKISRIHEIRLAGFEVGHVIHRHGMNEDTAFEVEAALIDAFPGITNIAGGHKNSDYGSMHSKEIISKYRAEEAIFKHKVLLISVNQSSAERSCYQATRYAWRLSKSNAEKADYVIATVKGVIKEVFIANEWLDASSENFPDREAMPGRYGFNGSPAPEDIRELYIGKRTPKEYRKKGASNPIKYSWT